MEADVYVWCDTLLVVHARKEEENHRHTECSTSTTKVVGKNDGSLFWATVQLPVSNHRDADDYCIWYTYQQELSSC